MSPTGHPRQHEHPVVRLLRRTRMCCCAGGSRSLRAQKLPLGGIGALLRRGRDPQCLEDAADRGRADPGGLGMKKLTPRRARRRGRRIDARSPQDLPHGGRRGRHPELGQFAVDPAVSPQRIPAGEANGQARDARGCRRAPRLAPLARVVRVAGQPAVPGQQRRWRDGEDFGPAPARWETCQRGEPHPSGRSYRTRPACRRSIAFSCRRTSSSASFARSPRNTRTARPGTRHVSR